MSMQDKNIVIGIIGLGEHMVRSHVEYLLRHPDVRVACWYDPGVPNLRGCSFEFSDLGTCVGHEDAIFNHPDVNTILIGSPDQYHPDQLLKAIEAGKHVFVEKPIAIDFDGFAKIHKALQLAREKGLVVSSCHPRRFDPPMVKLKQRLDNAQWLSEHVGTVTFFGFDFVYHQVTDPWKKDRSLMMDHLGHEIDLMRFLFNSLDPNVSLTAEKKVDDYSHYLVTGKLGDIDFRFSGSRILLESTYNEYVTIRGTGGELHLAINTGEATFQKNNDKVVNRFKLPPKNYEEMFVPVNNDFLDAIRTKRDPYLLYYDLYLNNYLGIFLDEKGTNCCFGSEDHGKLKYSCLGES